MSSGISTSRTLRRALKEFGQLCAYKNCGISGNFEEEEEEREEEEGEKGAASSKAGRAEDEEIKTKPPTKGEAGEAKAQAQATKSVRLKRCTSCRVAAYCSVEHQHADWKWHKSFCKRQPAFRKLEQSSSSADSGGKGEKKKKNKKKKKKKNR